MHKNSNHFYKRLALVVCGMTISVTALYEKNRLELMEYQNVPVMSNYALNYDGKNDVEKYQQLVVENNSQDEKSDLSYIENDVINRSDYHRKGVSDGRETLNNEKNSNNVKDNTVNNEDNIIKTYTKYETYNVPCEYVYDEELNEGNVVTTQEPQEGLKEVTVLASYNKNEEIDSVPIETEVVEEAVPMVIHIGTKKQDEFIIPVTDYVFTSPFGPRWGTNHNGVDLAVPEGTSVMAAASGTVVQEGWNGGYGISVYIDHGNGYFTRYGHLSETNVSVGQYVSQGDVVAYSGNTGDSTGPHLHFEIRQGDEPLDPTMFVPVE